MAPNAGHQLRQIVLNLSDIIAIELLCDVQARDLFPNYSLAANSEAIYQLIRKDVPYLKADGPLSAHIEHISELVRSGEIARIVKAHIQELV